MDGLWKDSFGILYRLTDVQEGLSELNSEGKLVITSYHGHQTLTGILERVDEESVMPSSTGKSFMVDSVMPAGMRALIYVREEHVMGDGRFRVIVVDESKMRKTTVRTVPIQGASHG